MYKASYQKHLLQFVKPVRTSRHTLTTHTVYYLALQRLADGRITYGEAAPLMGLSTDDVPGFEAHLQAFCDEINAGNAPESLNFYGFPSIQFAFETALLCMQHQQEFTLFNTSFLSGEPIKINGLVWMSSQEEMLQEAFQKVENGFTTIKFKVGALDFDEECRMLETFRKRFGAYKVDIRLDANGAFKNDEALMQLQELSRFEIHSLEQPIKAQQWEMMEEVCVESAIPIALDEELIGVQALQDGLKMLRKIKPAYLIIKPTLLGGLAESNNWVACAESSEIHWWATSALESNVGLNAIAQWVSTKNNLLPQGLGTGGLYSNNATSPLKTANGKIYSQPSLSWQLPVH